MSSLAYTEFESLKTLNFIPKGSSNVSSCSLSNNDFMYNLKLEHPVFNLCFINLQKYCTAVLHVVLQKLFLYCFMILDSLQNSSLS